MQTTSLDTTSTTIPPFDYPPSLHPCYAIAEGTTADDLARFLGIRLGHLCAMVSATSAEDEGDAQYLGACLYVARECRELFKQIEARRAS
jgi:hypothetical protein